MNTKPKQKPLLRGYFHQEAFFVSFGACTILMAQSPNRISFICGLIYTFGLLFLFGVSAIYHRPHWEPNARALLRKFDHSAIFILIACTFTPYCLLALPEKEGLELLTLIWSATVLGIAQSIVWPKAPKWLKTICYLIAGWLAALYLPEFKNSLSALHLGLTIAGGAFYSVGAIFYALKRPNLKATVFGYHELFHVFTIIAASMHFYVIYHLIDK